MPVQDEVPQVFGGVDTHDASIHVAVVDQRGRDLGNREFATTAGGYRQALAFLASYGEAVAVGSKARRPTAQASPAPQPTRAWSWSR